MRVQDPASGQIFELPAISLEAGSAANPTTTAAATLDADGDKVLTMKDRPAAIDESQWRAYLAHLATWAKLHPGALSAVTAVHEAEWPLLRVSAAIQQRLGEVLKSDRLLVIASELATDGITIVKTSVTDRSDGTIHRLARDGMPEARLAFHDRVPTQTILLRARLAMGVLPEPVRAFAAGLAAGESDKLTRLFARGSVRPEEVVYDQRDNRLYALVNTLRLEDSALVAEIGDERNDGPGVLKLTIVDGQLRATSRFEYFSSSEAELALE
jgi:hypothetical protein